jgi:hypothetical protein
LHLISTSFLWDEKFILDQAQISAAHYDEAEQLCDNYFQEPEPYLLCRIHVSSITFGEAVSMATLGNVQLSFVSGQQQTTLSAAALNFDFALVKVAPPKEYEGLGQCLSLRRKKEAEDGALHTVARKLGALFAGEIPAVPNLISAYGERASEISRNPKANPACSKTYSLFADHVGADATSLWAAATSGKSTITIHLLGCMLARIWSSAETISIWTELVACRKDQLKQRLENDEFQISDATSARIEITRDQLTAWDNSARYANVNKMKLV